MATATAPAPAPSLSRADAKLIGRYAFNEFEVIDDEADRRILNVSIFRYVRNAKGDALKHASSGISVRGERGQGTKVLKVVKATVKGMNAGTYEGPDVVLVSNGRPRGRSPKAA
jgi:hypothetical protein